MREGEVGSADGDRDMLDDATTTLLAGVTGAGLDAVELAELSHYGKLLRLHDAEELVDLTDVINLLFDTVRTHRCASSRTSQSSPSLQTRPRLIATKLVARGDGGGAVGETAQWPEKGGTITSLR